MRSITRKEYETLKAEKPNTAELPTIFYWREVLGARPEWLEGRIVSGGKIHNLRAHVIDLNDETVVIDAEQYCGSGRIGFQYHITLGGNGQRCGKCFRG